MGGLIGAGVEHKQKMEKMEKIKDRVNFNALGAAGILQNRADQKTKYLLTKNDDI